MNDKRDIGTCDKLYFGKYRGTVINNLDPMQMGRVQALVPDVTGDLPSSWAMPCLSVGGMQGGMFTVPIVGSGVWIEFEQGDLDRLFLWERGGDSVVSQGGATRGAGDHISNSAAKWPDDQRCAGPDGRHSDQDREWRVHLAQ